MTWTILALIHVHFRTRSLFPCASHLNCFPIDKEEDDFSSRIAGVYLGVSSLSHLYLNIMHHYILYDILCRTIQKCRTVFVFCFFVCFSAGFRHSLRLCRRRFHSTAQIACPAKCSNNCNIALNCAYEEVVRYQRSSSDLYRLIALLGT